MKSFLARSRWAAIGAAVAVSLGGGAVFVANAVEESPDYVSVLPCRLLDTRKGPPEGFKGVAETEEWPRDAIGNASIGRNPNVTGPQTSNDVTVYFDGDETDRMGNCDLAVQGFDDPEAIVMNVTALDAGGATYLTIYPWQTMTGDETLDKALRPLISQLNPVPNHHPFANMITVGLERVDGTGPRAFRIYNNVGRINVVIDVVGYYK